MVGFWRSLILVSSLLCTPLEMARAADHPVVLELFTSQGCPNCPPAERLLPTLGAMGLDVVIPLAFHVDYFDSPSWKDRFSRPDWTRRQHAYARLRSAAQLSTPQAIIDGGAVLQGSDEPAIRGAITDAAKRPAARVTLSAVRDGGQARLEIRIERPPELSTRQLDVMAAIFERGLETPLGETGRSFRNDYVVRLLDRVGRLSASDPTPTQLLGASLPLARDWAAAGLGVAVFLQDRKTLEIVGARALRLDLAR